MDLSSGGRLGPYEIISPLGSGGMGEVYRARDPRLQREVAIKILTKDKIDPERERRFQQEARAASALNHPNIVAVYDIGSENGTAYIVSELIEGESLRAQLKGEALPLKKLMPIAIQIADGISAAHEAGIVHRDLKPENIMVTRDGRAKILDFGLAKLLSAHIGSEDSETASAVLTKTGVIQGTVAYMSPEQAQGKSVDFRSDQFSFGLLLYEMTTGKRAFQRNTGVEILAAIIADEPPALQDLNPKLPAPLRWIIERCLSKDPAGRYVSTRDLYQELRSLQDHISDISIPAPAPSARRVPQIGLALLIATIILAAGGYMIGRRSGFLQGAKSAERPVPDFQQLTFRRGYISAARFAPDGQTIIYAAAWDGNPVEIFSERIENPESRSLGLPSASILSVSSTGELAISLGCAIGSNLLGTCRGTLARVPISGGIPREVLKNSWGADWSPDGKDLAVIYSENGRFRLEYPIGKVLYETSNQIGNPRISPGGDRIAFLETTGAFEAIAFNVLDLAGKKRTLSQGWRFVTGLAWSNNDEVWFTGFKTGKILSLYAVNKDGKERPVERMAGHFSLRDISSDGRVLITRDQNRWAMVARVPGVTNERDFSLFDITAVRDISTDGKLLLFHEHGHGASTADGIYLRNTEEAAAVKLGEGLPIALSPDEKWVLALTQSNAPRLVVIPTGAGMPVTLERDDIAAYEDYFHWFPDNKHILVDGTDSHHHRRSYIQEIGGKPVPLTPEGTIALLISPDGKRLLLFQNNEVWLRSVEGNELQPVRGITSDDEPIQWCSDGRSIFVWDHQPAAAKIFRVDLSTGERELIHELRPSDPAGITTFTGILPITADGKYYAYSYIRLLMELYLAKNLR